MVHVQPKDRLLLLQANQHRPQQRPLIEAERRCCIFLGHLLPLRVFCRGWLVAKIGDAKRQMHIRMNHLQRSPVHIDERGAERFMPLDDFIQSAFQHKLIDRSAQPEADGDVVHGAVRDEPIEEPETLLGVRQRQLVGTLERGRLNRAVLVRFCSMPQSLNPPSQFGYCLMGKNFAHRKPDMKQLGCTGKHLCRQKRVPAQFKKVVVHPDLRYIEHFLPDADDQFLNRIARRKVDVACMHAAIRERQRFAIDFSARCQRELFHLNKMGRHHVVGQCLAKRFTQRVDGPPLVCDKIRAQIRLPVMVCASDHDSVANRSFLNQLRANFVQFNPVAANFYLMVDPSEVLDVAILAVACQVARAVHALSRCKRMGHKFFVRQCFVVPIASRQARSGDAQFTGHADWLQLSMLVHDMRLNIGKRLADWHQHVLRIFCQGILRGINRRFGWAINIFQNDAWQRLVHFAHQLGRHRFPGGKYIAQWTFLLLIPNIVDERDQHRRHKIDMGHAVIDHRFPDVGRLLLRSGIENDQSAAPQNPAKNFCDRNVKSVGRLQQIRIVFQQRIQFLQGKNDVQQARVLDHDALRLARRTRCVDDVSQMVRMGDALQIVRCPLVNLSRFQIDDPIRKIDRSEKAMVHQQQFTSAILQNIFNAFLRMGRINRQVGPARLKNGQNRNHHLRGTLGKQTDHAFRTDSSRPQQLRQLICLFVQLPISKDLFSHDQRDALWLPLGTLFKHLVDQLICRIMAVRIVKGMQLQLFLCRINHFELLQKDVWRICHLCHDGGELSTDVKELFFAKNSGIVYIFDGDDITWGNHYVQVVVGLFKSR